MQSSILSHCAVIHPLRIGEQRSDRQSVPRGELVAELGSDCGPRANTHDDSHLMLVWASSWHERGQARC